MTTETAATELPVSRSVVAPEYKVRYRTRAATAKLPKDCDRKVIARSCGDWLAKTLAPLTVGPKRKADRAAFAAILDANGVDHSRWSGLDNGRFRMTGGLALRRVIVDAGVLSLPSGETITPPKAWLAMHTR